MNIGSKRAVPSQEEIGVLSETPSMVSNLRIATVAAIAGASLFFRQGIISPFVFASTSIAIGCAGLYQIRNASKMLRFKASVPCAFTEKRTSKIKKEISNAFQKLAAREESTWVYNGDAVSYRILCVNECRLIRDIIQRAPIEQKNFYIVDLGAGKFKLAETVAAYIKKNQHLLRPDQKIHIISVRGEKNKGDNVIDEGNVIRYNLGEFKIEDLNKAFPEKGFFLEDKVDLIVSSWTFRHFVDPLGSLAQTYQLLKAGSGLLLMDGFFSLDESNESLPDEYEANRKLKEVLTQLQVPVLLNYDSSERSLTQFVLERPDSEPFPLEREYVDVLELVSQEHSTATNQIARYHLDQQDVPDLQQLERNVYGDQKMLDRFKPIIASSRGLPC